MTKVRQLASSPIVIFACALATRLAATVYIFATYAPPRMLFVGNESSNIAKALVSGLGFSSPYAHTPLAPTAQQPPIYPLFIAGIFKVFGVCTTQSAWAITAFHIAAGAITALLILRLGTIYFKKNVGTIAAWLWVLPWSYEARAFDLTVSSHALAALGFTSLLLLIPKVMELNHGWLALGVCAGLLVLLQPPFLIVFIVYAVWLAWRSRYSPRMLLAVAGLLAVLAPWTVRNYVQFGRLIPIRDNFGLELWLGNHPGMHGTVDYSHDFPGKDPTNYVRLGEIAFMDSKLHEANDFIVSDPISFAGRCFHRVIEFWYQPLSSSWILVSVVGWIGAGFALRKHPLGWLFVIPLITFPLVYYVTHVFAHYRHPIDPVILLLAAYALVEMAPKRQKEAALET